LGANFYCEEKHVGKVSRAEACLVKLQELNTNVNVSIISSTGDLLQAIESGSLNVVCQTEMMIDSQYWDPEMLDKACR
jgi:hypothetical protein